MRRSAIIAVKIAVIAVALVYLFGADRLRFADLRVAAGGWSWIAAAASVALAMMLVSIVRYWLLLNGSGAGVSLAFAARISFIGWFFNATLLGGLGYLTGDAVKIGYLARAGHPWSAILGATLVDRFIGFVALLLMAAVSLQFAPLAATPSPQARAIVMAVYGASGTVGLAVVLAWLALSVGRIAAVVGWLAMLALTAMLASTCAELMILALFGTPALAAALLAPWLRPGAALYGHIERLPAVGRGAAALLATLAAYRGTLLGAALGISLIVYGLWTVSFYVAAQGLPFAHKPTLGQIWMAIPPATAVTSLPLPAGALGVGEAVFDAVLRLGATPEGHGLQGGAALFLVVRLVMIGLGMIGLPLFLWSGVPSPNR